MYFDRSVLANSVSLLSCQAPVVLAQGPNAIDKVVVTVHFYGNGGI